MAFLGIHNPEWWKQMEEAGVVPSEVRRVIIDIPLDEPAVVYYECYADKRMFSIDLVNLVSGTKAVNVMDVPDGTRRPGENPDPPPSCRRPEPPPPPPPNEKAF